MECSEVIDTPGWVIKIWNFVSKTFSKFIFEKRFNTYLEVEFRSCPYTSVMVSQIWPFTGKYSSYEILHLPDLSHITRFIPNFSAMKMWQIGSFTVVVEYLIKNHKNMPIYFAITQNLRFQKIVKFYPWTPICLFLHFNNDATDHSDT